MLLPPCQLWPSQLSRLAGLHAQGVRDQVLVHRVDDAPGAELFVHGEIMGKTMEITGKTTAFSW